MRAALTRIAAMLPDAITSGAFLLAWIAPRTLGVQRVTDLMLTMLVEFIVMHSSGFWVAISEMGDVSRSRRMLMLGALSAAYLLFVLGFSIAFDAIWPVYAFGWLIASRFVHLWLRPLHGGAASQRMMLAWAGSGMTYVAGAIATVTLPLPAFGITPDFVASMHLSGSGEWIERPYTVLAFGAFYFAAQSWIKYGLADGADSPTPRRRAQRTS